MCLLYQMSDSDDDPWPGACCGRLRFVSSTYYTYRYTFVEPFPSFFRADPRQRYSMYHIEGIVLDYITSHGGYAGKLVNYDEGLWRLFRLSTNEPFKIKRIEQYVQPFQQGFLRPCPICEQPRPFYPRIPNGLCEQCTASPNLLNSKGEPVIITKPVYTLLSAGSLLSYRAEPVENDFTLDGVHCRRTYSDSILLEAVVNCPLCKEEVKEERRLGAFCDRCTRSESLMDSNGNRVRFTPPTGEDYGFRVVRYEKGEIVEYPHMGEFVCFFQGVECVAEDVGVKERVIVRFRDRESAHRTWNSISLPPPMGGSFYIENIHTLPETIVAPATDWLDPRYPRWASY